MLALLLVPLCWVLEGVQHGPRAAALSPAAACPLAGLKLLGHRAAVVFAGAGNTQWCSGDRLSSTCWGNSSVLDGWHSDKALEQRQHVSSQQVGREQNIACTAGQSHDTLHALLLAVALQSC